MNLCFHGVGVLERERDMGEARYWVTVSLFERMLDLVASRDWVRLSFDDGNASDTRIVLPAMMARGLRGAFFPLAGRLGQRGSTDSDDLLQLVECGMSIGTHGMHHRSWRETRGADLVAELDMARSVLADVTRTPISTAACPLGDYDRRVLTALRDRGYTRVMTSDRARATAGSWLQPRFSVTAHDDVASVRALLDHREGQVERLQSRFRILAKRLR